jgi:hypothetical protein
MGLMPGSPLSNYLFEPIRCYLLSQGSDMRRREFISLLGGAAAWLMAAQAQQPDKVRRIGVPIGFAESDPVAQAYSVAIRDGLQALGWIAILG